MPTGHTSKIQKGITFPEFVMSCAHSIGYLITLRDEPSDAPIPIFEPGSYHRTKLSVTSRKLNRLKKTTVGMALKAAEKKAKVSYRQTKVSYEKTVSERNELRAKYEAMLEQVRGWEPPTPEHQGLELSKPKCWSR